MRESSSFRGYETTSEKPLQPTLVESSISEITASNVVFTGYARVKTVSPLTRITSVACLGATTLSLGTARALASRAAAGAAMLAGDRSAS